MRPFAGTLARAAAVAAFGLALPLSAAPTPPVIGSPAHVAQLGIELPTLGGGNWFTVMRAKYFTEAVMHDIRDNLHLDYVRTGWIPGRLAFEKIPWHREDEGMDAICASGLKMMIIVPGPREDRKGLADLTNNVHDFFARYTQREFGCIAYAEIVNEADLAKNGFTDVDAYADYYERVAPIVASFGIPVITTGTSGEDLPWTEALSARLRRSGAPVTGFGFHPYGVAPAEMAASLQRMNRMAAAVGPQPAQIYVTEIGEQRADDLYQAIVSLGRVTPALTLYEYLPQTGEDPRYGIASDSERYRAVQRAAAFLHGEQ